jgi:hypothetical protein
MSGAHRTGWKCEGCGAAGMIPHPANVDVYTMLDNLSHAHHLAAPGCTLNLGKVRVWPVAAVAPQEPEGAP